MKEISQQDLEDKTGISKRSISRLEQGESVQVISRKECAKEQKRANLSGVMNSASATTIGL